jgi:hypothetical protein
MRKVQRHPALAAAGVSVIIVILLGAMLVFDPALADRLTHEDGPVEWLQAALFALAAGLALRSAWSTSRSGASPVLEVLVAGMLAGLVIGEVDLDKVVLGHKIISTRFFVDARVGIGWRALAVLTVAGPPAALAIYALRRRGELVAAIRRAVREPWGCTLIVGLVIFGLTEVFERPLGRIPGLPRYLLEEALELIAGVWLGAAMLAHARATARQRIESLRSDLPTT